MSQGIKKRFFYLTWLVSTSLLANPSLVKNLLIIWRMMRERGTEGRQQPSSGMGEVLSLVADSKYQRYVPPGGKSRLTVRLFESMVEDFRSAGFDRIRLLVQPENRASNMFCNMMGCKFKKITVAGMVTHEFIYHLENTPPSLDSKAGNA